MDLSDLLSEDIALKLCLKSSIDIKKLTKLIQEFPKDFVETILKLQKDKRKAQYLSLPGINNRLKFIVRKKKLIIEFNKERKVENQLKFKALLGQIYEEIMLESQHQVIHARKYEHSVDEVDDMLAQL
ncbi:hypothetical protein DID80_04085 [Candidatus Marinamargulisbacteria bacterium SCGC AAA071-K20]|nr:hypothetical protein DID80_04085 [Candidatus Marinamargulisbacteria bacterium SCGC AAA071-K20]